MSTWLASFKLAAVTGYLQVLPSLDAVSNTQSIMKKVTNAFQIVGFAGAIAIGAGCFALMAWGGDRLRDKIKSHLVWIIISVMSTSCVILLIPFSNYRIMHSIIIKMAVLKKFHRSHRQANGRISRGTALIADGSKA